MISILIKLKVINTLHVWTSLTWLCCELLMRTSSRKSSVRLFIFDYHEFHNNKTWNYITRNLLEVLHSSITWLPERERKCIRRICRSIQNWSSKHLQTSQTPASTHLLFLDSFIGLASCTHSHTNIYFLWQLCVFYLCNILAS